MNAKELKVKLNSIVALVPERNGESFGDEVKLEEILDYLKDSVQQWNENSKKSPGEEVVRKSDFDFLVNQGEKKNHRIVDLEAELEKAKKEISDLNNIITEQENSEEGNPNSESDKDELLKAYGIDSNSTDLDKIKVGFDIINRLAGKERVRAFTDVAISNLTLFVHDDDATLKYLKEKLPEALKSIGFEKVEGKLKIAEREALND